MLLDLPLDILESVFICLDGASFGRLLLTCRRLSGICSDERFWQQRCKNILLVETLAHETWRQQYGNFYRQFAKLGDNWESVYRKIRSAWFKIERFFNTHSTGISFDNGASWEDIREFQQQLGENVELPADFICSLMIHNGQKIDENVLNGLSSGAMGSLYAYEEYKTEFLASIMNVLIAQNHANADRRRPEQFFVCLTIAVTNRSWSNSHLLCVSRNVEGEGKVKYGNVISAPQLRHRFDNPSWVVASSYTEWLENFANAVDEGRYALSRNEPVTDNNELLRFYWPLECEARTGPFICRVATAFVPEHSSVIAPRFYFAYRVSFEMDSNADDSLSCQLESRHWVITDGNGKVDRIDGPGVIGEFPVLRPGSTFSYVSCTYFVTQSGQMTGHFTMKYFKGGVVDIVCPVFTMKAPEYDILRAVAPVVVQEGNYSSDDESA